VVLNALVLHGPSADALPRGRFLVPEGQSTAVASRPARAPSPVAAAVGCSRRAAVDQAVNPVAASAGLRQLLLPIRPEASEPCPGGAACSMAADRAQHVQERLAPRWQPVTGCLRPASARLERRLLGLPARPAQPGAESRAGGDRHRAGFNADSPSGWTCLGTLAATAVAGPADSDRGRGVASSGAFRQGFASCRERRLAAHRCSPGPLLWPGRSARRGLARWLGVVCERCSTTASRPRHQPAAGPPGHGRLATASRFVGPDGVGRRLRRRRLS